MSFETWSNTIRTRFKTQIADARSLPTQYDNQAFDPPDNQLWARLTILFGESRQVSNGGPNGKRYRTSGVMTVQLFQPLGMGDKNVLEMADIIANAFRSVTDSDVVFRVPGIARVGRINNWWQINVKCPFYADNIA